MSSENPTLELIHGRISAEQFDPSRALTDEELRELVDDATQAPSSFNIQHWRFVCVRRPEAKKKLRALAFDQAPVEDAAATFVVLGDLEGHNKLAPALRGAVDEGILSRRTADLWVKQAAELYREPQLARDEAIRSGSLAAMTMMLAAAARGLISAPMIGFDPAGVKREFKIADHLLPVMLLAVGHPAPAGNPPRKPRLPVDEVLAFDDGTRFS